MYGNLFNPRESLVQYLGQLGEQVQVIRNDEIPLTKILDMEVDRVLISPGPGHPKESKTSVDLIKAFKGKLPILGVCLGHQCIVEAFGGKVCC